MVQVIGRHAIAAECLGQAFDRVPVQLKARTHHQLLILDDPASIDDDGVMLRLEGGHGSLDPMHAARNNRGHGARRIGGSEHAAAHQRPARLVVMHLGRVDDRDIEAGFARQQAGGSGNACGAATDDDHRVRRFGHVDRCAAMVGDAPHHAFHVEAGLPGGLDDLRKRHLPGLRKGPHGGRAHPGPAIGEHRLGKPGKQFAKCHTLRIADLSRFGRQVIGFDAARQSGTFDLGKQGLVAALAVGTVTDNGAESGFLEPGDLVRQELFRDP